MSRSPRLPLVHSRTDGFRPECRVHAQRSNHAAAVSHGGPSHTPWGNPAVVRHLPSGNRALGGGVATHPGYSVTQAKVLETAPANDNATGWQVAVNNDPGAVTIIEFAWVICTMV